MKKTMIRATFGACLAVAAVAAQAGTLTTNGWLFGSGNAVAAGIPSYSGQAGGFKATLAGLSDPRFNFSPVELYCVDLLQTIDITHTYSVKIDGEGGPATTFTIASVGSVFGALIGNRLAELVSYAESNLAFVDNAAESTSMQLAVWNTIYDTDNTLDDNLASATDFKDTSAYRAYANTLLANSLGFTANKELFVLKSSARQDQLFWIDSSKVPEPGTLALGALALAGLAGTRRRAR